MPAIVAATDDRQRIPHKFGSRSELLDVLRVDHGPPELLGRFFLAADSALKGLGLTIVLSSLAELAELQAKQIATWPLFAPMLDPKFGGVDPEMSYGFIGLDRDGVVACAQGGRVFDTGTRTLKDMVDDQTFFYGPGRTPQPGEPQCSTTAPSASRVRGLFTYSGALWVHPAHRGNRLAALLPRLSRAYALTRWDARHTVAVVSDQIAKSPLMSMYAYKTVEREFGITNVGVRGYTGCLMILTADELLSDLASFMSERIAQVDATVRDGGTQHDTAIRAKLQG